MTGGPGQERGGGRATEGSRGGGRHRAAGRALRAAMTT